MALPTFFEQTALPERSIMKRITNTLLRNLTGTGKARIYYDRDGL